MALNTRDAFVRRVLSGGLARDIDAAKVQQVMDEMDLETYQRTSDDEVMYDADDVSKVVRRLRLLSVREPYKLMDDLRYMRAQAKTTTVRNVLDSAISRVMQYFDANGIDYREPPQPVAAPESHAHMATVDPS